MLVVNVKGKFSVQAQRVLSHPVFDQRGRILSDLSQLMVHFDRGELPETLGG